MSIEIQCPSCKKRFRVEDRFAGKRVKCRNCAAAITVPAGDDVDELEDLQEVLPDGGVDEEVHDAPAADVDAPDELPQGFGAALMAARSRLVSRRFALSAYPGAALAHQYLPWIVGLICVGLSIYLAVERVLQSPPPHGMIATIVGLSVVLFFAAVVPMTSRGLTSAARMLKFDLPQGAGWRVLGLFSLPLLLSMMLSDSLGGVVAGIAVGLLMLMPLLWVVFQLHWVEAMVAWMMTSLFFAGSAAAVGGVVFLVGLGIALSTDTGQVPPENVKVAVKPGPSTKPVDITAIIPPATQHAMAPVPPATQGAEMAIAPPPDLPPVLPPVLPPPATMPTGPETIFSDKPNIPPVTIPGPPKPPVPAAPKSEHVKIDPSPLVASAKEIEGFVEGDEIIDPDSSTSPLAIRKRTPQGDMIEVYKRDEDKLAGTVSFKRDAAASDRYILAPAGDMLVRTVSWPKLGLQQWTTADGHAGKIIDIDPVGMNGEPLCFLSADLVLVHRWQGPLHGVQVYSMRGTAKPRGIDVLVSDQVRFPFPQVTDRNYAIAPNGRLMAIAARENSPQLYIIDVAAGRLLRKIAIPMDARWPVTPAGLAFSPDSLKVAILFEQEGNMLALAWSAASGVKTQEAVYTAGQLSVPPQFHGRALDYLADNNTWLMYGNLLIDSSTGKPIGDVGVASATSQRVVDGKHVYLEAAAENGTARLVHVELNAEALAKPRPVTTKPLVLPSP